MHDMLTLPGLQNALDAFPRDGSLAIAKRDIERLFGLNDVAVGRIANFARGHGCKAILREDILTFSKHAEPSLPG
jgi:hypothetical protein